MDLGAYHRAWLGGATEAEAIRAGEDAFLEEQEYYNQAEQEYYKEAEQEYYKELDNKTTEEAGREQGMGNISLIECPKCGVPFDQIDQMVCNCGWEHECGGPQEACCIPGCLECGAKKIDNKTVEEVRRE